MESSLECRLLYESADGVYVSLGKASGLQPGTVGWLHVGQSPVSRVEVVGVAETSSLVRILGARPGGFPAAGDAITLVVDLDPKPRVEPRKPSPTIRDRGKADVGPADLARPDINAPAIPEGSRAGILPEGGAPAPADGAAALAPLTPLLATEKKDIDAFSDAYNIWKGQAWLKQQLQTTPGAELNSSVTRVGSSGSVERVDATPWAVEWSGEGIYRDGEALEQVKHYQDVRFELYRLSAFRRFADESMVRVGRFLPRELPSAGYLDGAQGEFVINERLRLGGMFGLKPRRVDLGFTVDEPTAVGYMTAEFGRNEPTWYQGTLGFLSSAYKGKFDRMAILADQTLRLRRWTILSSSAIDFDVGGSEVHSGTRLTRWDLSVSHPLGESTTIRGGLDRFERLDTAAERDATHAFTVTEEDFIDRGYWRYWLGARHQLPAKLYLSEEVSLTDSAIDDFSLRWNVSLTRSDVPFLTSGSSATLTLYNLVGQDLDGYGGRLSAHVPLPARRLSIQPAVAFRFLQSDLHEEDTFTFTDVSLRGHWVMSSSWSASAGVSYAFTNDPDLQRLYADFGVTFKW